MRGMIIALIALGLTVAACESDPFGNDPVRRRAVQNPIEHNTGVGEAMAGDASAVPIVTVDLPNNVKEPAHVHTIADDIGNAAAPTTNPANPASQPAAAADWIKVIRQQKKEDKITISADAAGTPVITVICSSGIGSMEIQRVGERWPEAISVHLMYDAANHFTNLEGFSANLQVDQLSKQEVKSVIHKADGTADLTIPVESTSKLLMVDWVDAWR